MMRPVSGFRQVCADYYALTKPGVTVMVVITTLVGYYLGIAGEIDTVRFLLTLLGTALVAGGTSALNQLIEIEIDGRMKRTHKRPLPAGRLTPLQVHVFATAISCAGLLILTFFVNPLTGFLAALTLGSYVFIYTPMKRKSSLSTLVGAIPGALPPVGGWAAARGELGLEAWILFGILFFWQLPHFLAIAWIYREDYARGGLPVLPVLDKEGSITSRHILINTMALLVVSLMPTLIGTTGTAYFIGAVFLGLGFLAAGVNVALQRSNRSASRLLLASIIYLPVLLALMTIDKIAL